MKSPKLKTAPAPLARTSITDVARRAGCALGSASKVLNGVEGVSQELRDRVLKAADELGYIPNRSARMLKSGRTWRLGVVMPFASDLFYSRLLDAYNDAALSKGYRLEILFHQWNEEEESRGVKHLIESGVEGLILHSCHHPLHHAPYRSLLKSRCLPHVFSGVLLPDSPPAESIENSYFLDMEKGVEMLAEHLIRLGHRRLSMLAASKGNVAKPEMELRIRGAERAIARHPGTSLQTLFIKALPEGKNRGRGVCQKKASVEHFQECIQDLVQQFSRNPQKSTAVIAINQMTAWLLIQSLSDRGYRVPEDISVVSLALSHTEHFAGFPLTTAEYSPLEIAKQAIAIALGERRKGALLEPTFVQRRSSAPPAAFSGLPITFGGSSVSPQPFH